MKFKEKCVNNFQRLHFFFHPNFASSIIRKSAKLLIHANVMWHPDKSGRYLYSAKGWFNPVSASLHRAHSGIFIFENIKVIPILTTVFITKFYSWPKPWTEPSVASLFSSHSSTSSEGMIQASAYSYCCSLSSISRRQRNFTRDI